MKEVSLAATEGQTPQPTPPGGRINLFGGLVVVILLVGALFVSGLGGALDSVPSLHTLAARDSLPGQRRPGGRRLRRRGLEPAAGEPGLPSPRRLSGGADPPLQRPVGGQADLSRPPGHV